MGMFLSLAAVINAHLSEVESGLASYTRTRKGSLIKAEATDDDPDVAIIAQARAGISVRYPANFLEWDDASQFLSSALNQPVFSFHIHDGDLWMFRLFKAGEEIARFNPIPDYWEELSSRDIMGWVGDVPLIASQITDISSKEIERYFVQWTDDILDDGTPKKAYPEDEYAIGNCWQLLDFMRRCRFAYPYDDDGHIVGTMYRLLIPSEV